MARRAYGRRYAQAVFEIALGRKELDQWQADLERISRLTEDAGLVAVLGSPKFPLEAKAKLLSERLGKINPLAFNVACLLVSKLRFGLVTYIAEEYQRLLNSYRGIEEAEVTTAITLADADKQRLSERLAGLTGKKIVLKSQVDTGMIGGIIARVGDKLIDGSIRSQLQALRREMESAGA